MCNFEFVVGLDVYTAVWDLYEKPAKTVKVDIAGASKETDLTLLNGIVNKVEKIEIPPSLVLNLGQINSKYVYTDKQQLKRTLRIRNNRRLK